MRPSATCFRWRRCAVLLAVISLLLASAGTALAAPGSKPAKQVTMALIADAEGLATTCLYSGSGPIALSGSGVLRGLGQDLAARIDVSWYRDYDVGYGLGGTSLTGCHGPGLNDHTGARPDPNNPGVLEITPRGDTVEILWRFDYYVDPDGRVMPNGKKTLLLEFLELSSNGPVSWTDTDDDRGPDTVDGLFTLRRYAGGAWFSPFSDEIHLTFTLTIK
jgi:hypothetical protein